MIYVFRYSLIVLYTVFWGLVCCVAVLFDRSGDFGPWVGRHWVDWIFRTCGIRVVVEGLDHIDPEQPYIFMCNHQSVADIGVLILTLPVSWRFVAKRELLKIPFFGWAVAASRQVVIDRGNRPRAVESLKIAAARIRGGVNVIIFPEGTRSETGEMRGFKSGGFHLAIESGAPILPVTVSGSQRITPKRSLRVESGTIKIVYGRPIPTDHLDIEDRHALKETVRKAIAEGYDWSFQAPLDAR